MNPAQAGPTSRFKWMLSGSQSSKASTFLRTTSRTLVVFINRWQGNSHSRSQISLSELVTLWQTNIAIENHHL
jgi:hypothetical protein